MHLGLFVNGLRDKNFKISGKLINLIEKRGIGYDVSVIGGKFSPSVDIETLVQKSTVLISLGGDGTVLALQQAASVKGVPVLGVNLGHLGFLAETEPEELENALDKIVSGKYNVVDRAMLKATVSGKVFYALNEVVLSKGANTHLMRIVSYLDGKLLDKYTADGIILATATGSTAYSLSSGGPIVGPDLNAFIINPICPHSLRSRPLIVSAAHRAEFTADCLESPAQVIVDGKTVVDLADGVSLSVEKAARTARFIKLGEEGFYDRLMQKLSYWGLNADEEE